MREDARLRRGWAHHLRSALLAGAASLAAVTFDPACNSPFIPIPPPSDPAFEPVMVPDAMGGMKVAWQVRGGAGPGAKVFVFNDTLRVGVITLAGADGLYVTGLLDGVPGDRVDVSYETADTMEKSSVLCRLLTQGQTSPKQACP